MWKTTSPVRGQTIKWTLGVLAALCICLCLRVEIVPPKATFCCLAKLVVGGHVVSQNAWQWQEPTTEALCLSVIETLESAEMMRMSRERVIALYPDLQDQAVDIRVAPPTGSGIIHLLATGEDAEYTRVFLNAVLDEYISFRQSMREQAQGRILSTLVNEVISKQKELAMKEEALERFCAANSALMAANSINQAAEERLKLRRRHQDLKHAHTDITLAITDIPAALVDAEARAPNGQQLTTMETLYLKARSELSLLESERDDPAQAIRAESVAKARQACQIAEARVREQMKLRLSLMDRQLTALDEQLVKLETAAADFNLRQMQLERLQSDSEASKAAYQQAVSQGEAFQLSFNTHSDVLAIQERAPEASEHVVSRGWPLWRLWTAQKIMTKEDKRRSVEISMKRSQLEAEKQPTRSRSFEELVKAYHW